MENKKFILDESKASLKEEILLVTPQVSKEVEIPVVTKEEEIISPELEAALTKEEIPEVTVAKNAYSGIIKDAIQKEFESINNLDSLVSTFTSSTDQESKSEKVLPILKMIIDEKYVHIGALQKALEEIDSKETELMKQGEEKANEVI